MMPRKFAGQDLVEESGFFPFFIEFQEYVKVQHSSYDTLRRHRSALKKFILWCYEQGLNHPGSIRLEHLEKYKCYLFYYVKANGQPLSRNSQGVLLTPLKIFFYWLMKQGYISDDPAYLFEIPKKIRALPPYILTNDEVERVMAQPDLSTHSGVRDRTILEVLYSTGIRRGECARLMFDDIDLLEYTCRINDGKGHQDRLIPIGARAVEWVDRYLRTTRPKLTRWNDVGNLFITNRGKHYSRSNMAWHVKKYLKLAGIDVKGACHLFRHAMATGMLENGADIRHLQVILGHKDLNTTQIYTHVSIAKLKEVHSITHPTYN